MNDNIEKYRLFSDSLSIPETIYYMKNFITPDEEQTLINNVMNSPKPKWTVLSNRRLQNWGGLPHPKGMIQEDLPKWLQTYASKLSQINIFDANLANHVLINEYLSGQGIMAHEDGPLFYPTVATINTGSHTLLNFYPKINDENEKTFKISERELLFSLFLEPRSVLVLKRTAYESYLHGIEEVKFDTITDRIANLSVCDNLIVGQELERKTRLSFTIRYVPKVLKTNCIFPTKHF